MYKALGFDFCTTAKLHNCEILILQLFLDNKTQGTLPGASPFAAVNSTHSQHIFLIIISLNWWWSEGVTHRNIRIDLCPRLLWSYTIYIYIDPLNFFVIMKFLIKEVFKKKLDICHTSSVFFDDFPNQFRFTLMSSSSNFLRQGDRSVRSQQSWVSYENNNALWKSMWIW